MKTTRLAGRGRILRAFLGLGTILTLATTPLVAQETRADPECRCVDADGEEIENCTCLRTFPRGDDLLVRSFGLTTNRPRMGISVDVTQGSADDALGARVTDVVDGGPAEEAGLREGDVITRVDGHSLFDSVGRDAEEDFDLDRSIPVQRLLALARDLEPGEEVEVEYLRDGESHTTTLTAEELPAYGLTVVGPEWREAREHAQRLREEMLRQREALQRGQRQERLERLHEELRMRSEDAPMAFFREMEPRGGGVVRLWTHEEDGLRLLELNPRLAESFGVDGGVLVVDVDPESPLGLEAGDVIQRIGERSVDTPQRARRILRSYGADEEITFHVVRDGRSMSVAGRLGR